MHLTDLSRRYCNDEVDTETRGKTSYELFALTVHHGSLNAGHYIAYVKREETWYNFNDEYYQICSQKEALSQEAYLLFYR